MYWPNFRSVFYRLFGAKISNNLHAVSAVVAALCCSTVIVIKNTLTCISYKVPTVEMVGLLWWNTSNDISSSQNSTLKNNWECMQNFEGNWFLATSKCRTWTVMAWRSCMWCWAHLQDLRFIPTYFVAFLYACWANFDFSSKPCVRLHLCSLMCTSKGLLASPM
jgi:hypothetical protein